MTTMKKTPTIRTLSVAAVLATAQVAVIAFTSCGGSDNNSTTPQNVYIRFSVDNGNNPATRTATGSNHVRTYKTSTTDGSTFLLSVSETDGFPETTNATVAVTRGLPVESAADMSDFTTYCYDEGGRVYYENIASDHDGRLREQKVWPQGKPLRFYAIHPHDAAKASFTSSPTSFNYTYSVSTSVEQQPDLMYASTGMVPFNSEGLARLHFHHALAAIRVKVGTIGGNVIKINAITLKNVRSKGTLNLPATDETATWTFDNTAGNLKDYAITGLDMTNLTQGTLLNPNEKTFLMLPQSLDNITIEIGVTFSNGTTSLIRQTLTGENPWAAGKTRTYNVNIQ